MPKTKPQAAPTMAAKKSRHSMDVNRANHTVGHSRDRATVKRLHMYKTKAFKHDRSGRIIKDAGDLTSTTPQPGAGKVAPNRKWFGNTRVVDQNNLKAFRDAMTKAQADPFSVLIKQKKLPMALVHDPDTEQRALAGSQIGLLVNEPFDQTFSSKRRRKRPKLMVSSYEQLLSKAQNSADQYEHKIQLKEEQAEEYAKKAAADAPPDPDAKPGLRFDDMRNARRERVFDKGQSKRIWGELHKVVDSSDVVIQVLDARDPMGTRCTYLEKFMKRQCSHKHMIFLLNKADLVPTWITTRWLKILTKHYPTLVFHSSITNPFGKGSLINLLRQFKALHPDKKSISCGLVGYPNVGKSSVINTLRGKKVSKVAPIPGETKVWQYVNLFRSIFLIDCPGVVHDSTKNSQSDAILKGVVRIESLRDMAAEYIPGLLERVEAKHIEKTYGIKSWQRSDDLLEQMARKSGKLLKGGEPDVSTAARMMLNDFQRGKLPWFTPPPGYEDKNVEDQQENDDSQSHAKSAGDLPGAEKSNDVGKQEEERAEDEPEEAQNEPSDEALVVLEHENIKKLKISKHLRDIEKSVGGNRNGK